MASKIWVRASTTAVALSLLIPLAVIGQSTGGTTTTPTTGSTGAATGRTTTPSPTTTTTNPTSTPAPVSVPQPIFLNGRVMLEDGTPPPGLVTIETVCNRSAHSEGYTDSRGYFAIELGARNGVIQDASETDSRGRWNTSVTSTSGTTGPLGGSQSLEIGRAHV